MCWQWFWCSSGRFGGCDASCSVGNIWSITTDGGFTPTTLPKQGYAPIKLHGYGKIETDDGSPPPSSKR